MPEGGRYAQVIVDIASADTDRVFTYRLPDGMRICEGTRVLVPFGRQTLEGCVIALSGSAELPEDRIRDVIQALDGFPAILSEMVALAREIAARAHCPLAQALRLMIPPEMRAGRVGEADRRQAFHPSANLPAALSASSRTI